VTNTLILGGARSGKSRRALDLAERAGAERIFIATAQAFDDEMTARIAHHKMERGVGWKTVEEPLDLADAIAREAPIASVCVVDCLTLWLSNLMHYQRDVEAEADQLCAHLIQASTPIILVSNELGMGLVPDTSLGRSFRDAQGRLNQAIARACHRVEFIAAGLPISLKG